MNPWSARRKLIYLSIGVVLLLAIVVIAASLFLVKKPNCFDGKQNGNETGVDCGGSCQRLCNFEAIEPSVIWSRAFKVTDGVYSAAAYIENPNINSEGWTSFTFKLYDSKNTLIASKENVTFIPKNKVFAIFEPNIQTGSKIPTRTTFEFNPKPEWRRNTDSPPSIVVTQKVLTGETTSPRIDATVENKTTDVLERVEVVALVYDSQGQAIAASRTYVDKLGAESSSKIAFTWPKPFVVIQETCANILLAVATSTASGMPVMNATSAVATTTPNLATSTPPQICTRSPSVVEILPRVIPKN